MTSTADNGGYAYDVFAEKDKMWGFGLVRDPLPKLAEMAAQCPVHKGSISGYFDQTGPDSFLWPNEEQFSALGFDQAEEVLREPTTFSSNLSTESLGPIIGKTILEMDPPEHGHYRYLIQGAFTKKAMQVWEEGFVRDIVASLLDEIAPAGRGDLSGDFAFHFPIAVIATACGLPTDDISSFYEKAAVLTSIIAPTEVRLDAAELIGGIVRELINERRVDPADDLISVLCHAEFRHADETGIHRLTDDAIIAFIRLLVPAGAQTTYRTLSNLLFALLTHPNQLEAVNADRSLIPQAVEEALRWQPPLIASSRRAIHETVLGGVPIEEGQIVNSCLLTAKHDPQRWDQPNDFDIFRAARGHLCFGTGPHVCLGIHLARMKLRVALDEILDRLPGLHLDPDAEDIHIDGLMARTAIHLPCRWETK